MKHWQQPDSGVPQEDIDFFYQMEIELGHNTYKNMTLITENNKTIVNTNNPIDEFEQEYPELAKEFKRIQEEQYILFGKKMIGYGLGNISVGTNLETEEEKKLSLTGIWFRVNDKVNRLKQLVLLGKNNPLEDESVVDTWKDLSVYGIISQIVTNGKWKK